MFTFQGQGTVKPYAGFNAEEDCKILRKAMKGIGLSKFFDTRLFFYLFLSYVKAVSAFTAFAGSQDNYSC
jgi:hypothetical protein